MNLSHNKIEEVSNFDQTSELKELRLNDNKIHSISNSIEKLQKLSMLDLGNNKLPNTKFLTSLAKLPKLINLSIRNNIFEIAEEDEEKIFKTLPKLYILNNKK